MVKNKGRWRTRLPLLTFACVDCPCTLAHTGQGRFRVNANGEPLHVCLLVNCVGCDRTGELTVHDRVPVRSLPADLLDGYTANAPDLVAHTLMDPWIVWRNRFTLLWDGCWELHAPTPSQGPWPVRVLVVFDDPVPLRPERLLAQGLGLSRGEVARRVKTDIPLNRRRQRDFSFLLV